MAIKKSSKTKDKIVKKDITRVKKLVENKMGTKKTSQNNKKTCKIKGVVSKVLSFITQHKKRITRMVFGILAFSIVFGSVPMYCYVTKTIAERYEKSAGYRNAIFGWLKVVMSRKPNEKIKLEGENLVAYNAIKKYAVKVADVYPSLRNLQIKASILTPVDSMGTINTYKTIIDRAGKYDWCPVCQDLIISKKEKDNYRYYFEIAKLYEKIEHKEQAKKYISISIEKFKQDNNLSSNKKLYKILEKKQSDINKMSTSTGNKDKVKVKTIVKKAITKKDVSKNK